MLVPILIVASIQLGLAGLCFAIARRKGTGEALVAMGGLVLLAFCLMSPLLLLQALLLLIVAVAMRLAKRGSVEFLSAGAVLTMLIVLAAGFSNVRQWSAARKNFPLVSLADRLDYEHRHAQHEPAAPDDEPLVDKLGSQLTELENLYAAEDYRGNRRADALRMVHASQVEQFVSSPGFGVGRGVRPWMYLIPLEKAPPMSLPPAQQPGDLVSAEADALHPLAPLEGPLVLRAEKLHERALLNFANPETFGYFQDVDHVAGFESHRMSEIPGFPCGENQEHYRMRRVELVSLLKHDAPMVYVSANLPRMEDLRDAPVRPLDSFEQQALAALQDGQQLLSQSSDDRIRMLGAVRAVRQCQQCHDVERGALLGAFSYELRRDTPAVEVPAEPAKETPAL